MATFSAFLAVQRCHDVSDPLDLSCILGVSSQWEGASEQAQAMREGNGIETAEGGGQGKERKGKGGGCVPPKGGSIKYMYHKKHCNNVEITLKQR